MDRLFLYCEGKQVGCRHLGDIDDLDSPNGRAAYPGRWYYNTFPLPLEMTKGKAELHFEIRSSGRIWGYGTNFDQYQKPMTEATRGLYRVYTQTSGFFTPPAGEEQGEPPANPPVRKSPGQEISPKWRRTLIPSLRGCSRIRVRSGRTSCGFSPAPIM
ncbi:MAG: hypothetical protein QM796_04645 [Chthoniobacteraceae bacterium]